MGKQIDQNYRLSDEDRAWLLSRGRGHEVIVNERRFGTQANPINDDQQGPQESAFYDNSVREKAVYDVGGAPLPDTVLDHNTGRVYDRDNGVLVEFTGPGHTPGAFDLRDGRRDPYDPNQNLEFGEDDGVALDENGNPVDDHIDQDIVDHVTSAKNVGELKTELSELNEKGFGESADSDDKREDLENKLAIALQDERDGVRNDSDESELQEA